MKEKFAVFIDRDGTISPEMGYVNHEDRYKLLPNTPKAIKKLNNNNILAIVCTNQAGVARGYFKENVIKKVHAKMKYLLAQKGAYLDDVYYCPHHPTVGPLKYRKNCSCRKPKTGMLDKALKKYKIDAACSYVVGDKISDVMWGHKKGMKAVMVLTGYGRGEYVYQRKEWKDKPDYLAKDLYDAVCWIIKDVKSRKR